MITAPVDEFEDHRIYALEEGRDFPRSLVETAAGELSRWARRHGRIASIATLPGTVVVRFEGRSAPLPF